MTCPHTNIETVREITEVYSNGMFGLPASNMPIAIDLDYEETRCLDCGARVICEEWYNQS